MKTRVNRNFIYRNDDLNFETLLVKANMLGYPYFGYEDDIYFVKATNSKKLRHVLVTPNIEEV